MTKTAMEETKTWSIAAVVVAMVVVEEGDVAVVVQFDIKMI
jgi:hypothetical protein